MTYAQKHGSTDMEIIIFRKVKKTGLLIAVWPYVKTSPGKVRYQFLLHTDPVIYTSEQSYGWLMAHSVAATAEECHALHSTLQLLGYWYSVDTRRYASHWSFKYN